MARKMKTMDVTMRLHMFLMRLRKLRLFIRLHLHPLWRKPWMNGQQTEDRIFSDRPCR